MSRMSDEDEEYFYAEHPFDWRTEDEREAFLHAVQIADNLEELRAAVPQMRLGEVIARLKALDWYHLFFYVPRRCSPTAAKRGPVGPC